MNKVQLVKLSNKEYRGLDMPSYSLLKRLDEFGPRNFTKSFKIEGDSIDFGSYVDCILFTPEVAEEEFYFEAIEKPTTQLLELADYIVNNLMDRFDNYYKNNEATEDLSRAIGLFGSIKDYDKRVAKFDNDLFWNYLASKRDALGKTILSIDIKSEAAEALEILKSHNKTTEIFFPNGNKEAINQLQLVSSINGVQVKAMLDRVIVDHDNKKVYAYDLKCTDVRQITFPYWFKKMKYYLQASLYTAMLAQYVEESLPGYTLEPFRFIVYSRSDKYPFVWKVSSKMLENGLFGFYDERGIYNKGIKQLLAEYKYYVDNNNFNIEAEFIENDELELL